MNDQQKIFTVYMITNTSTGKVYVGNTQFGVGRWHIHQGMLKRRGHTNPHLQADFDRLGMEHFEYSVLETNIPSKKEANRIEQEWVDAFPEVYNIVRRGKGKQRRHLSVPEVKERATAALIRYNNSRNG